jgi:hypothetical protein
MESGQIVVLPDLEGASVPRGLMIVHSRPASQAEADAYHRWYDEVHLPELLAVDGFTGARRLAAEDGETFLAVYEVDDVDAAKTALAERRSAGTMTPPQGVQLDPPPTVQWYTEL